MGCARWRIEKFLSRQFTKSSNPLPHLSHPHTDTHKNCHRQLQTTFGCCTTLQSNHMTKYVKHSSAQQNQACPKSQHNAERSLRDVLMWKTYESNKSGYLSFRQPCQMAGAIKIISYLPDACRKGPVWRGEGGGRGWRYGAKEAWAVIAPLATPSCPRRNNKA